MQPRSSAISNYISCWDFEAWCHRAGGWQHRGSPSFQLPVLPAPQLPVLPVSQLRSRASAHPAVMQRSGDGILRSCGHVHELRGGTGGWPKAVPSLGAGVTQRGPPTVPGGWWLPPGVRGCHTPGGQQGGAQRAPGLPCTRFVLCCSN